MWSSSLDPNRAKCRTNRQVRRLRSQRKPEDGALIEAAVKVTLLTVEEADERFEVTAVLFEDVRFLLVVPAVRGGLEVALVRVDDGQAIAAQDVRQICK